MTETYRFFDAVTYSESDFARVLSRLVTTGVLATRGAALAVSNGTGLVNVGTGEAFVEGFWYQNDATKPLAIAPNAGATARVDRIVVALDRTANTLVAQVHQGVVGGGPPTLTQVDGGNWELELAQVSVASSVQTLTDMRTYAGTPQPLTTVSDIIVANASGVPIRMAKGANNSLLGVDNSGNLGYLTAPRVTSLQVNTATAIAGGIASGGRVQGMANGFRVAANQALAPSNYMDLSLATQAPGIAIIAIHGMYGDYGLSRCYLAHRNASSSNYFTLSQFGTDLAGAAGGIAWTVGVQFASGVYRVTNTSTGGLTVTFNVDEFPLLNAAY